MTKLMKYVGILALILAYAVNAKAEEWIDVTSLYVTNPNFAGNSNDGWTVYAWANSTTCNYGCQEFWNGNFWECSQEVTIPKGHYRISVQGFHRLTNNSNSEVENYSRGLSEEIPSVLYANEESVPLVCVYKHYLEQNIYNGCWAYTVGSGAGRTTVYYPNNMQTAAYCFAQGLYNNELEFDVTEGTLTFGIRNNEYKESNWCIFTNWRLEYYGNMVLVSSITLNTKSKTLVNGETLQLTATVKPTNATLPNITWSSSNKKVATVDQDGLVKAVGIGNATITAAANDGSGKTATCTITVTANNEGLKSLIANEIQSANLDQNVDPSWNYGGWVELYNPTTTGVTLTGCWVSDDANNLQKVHISQPVAVPAQGFQNLWFDHHDKYCPSQLDMKLDVEGGTFYLSDENGKLILSQNYPPTVARCSYARKSIDGDEWAWSSTPTPEATNEGMAWADIRLPAPEVNQPTQIFGSNLTVCVNIPQGATLRYTTDGSTPTATNGQTSTTGLFYPSETTTYRFGLIQDGYLPSPVVTRSYIHEDKTFALPVVSVAGNEADLYGDDMGILVRGNGHGRPGNGQSTACNWNMDWDRSVNFEYINQEGEMVINQETAMERCGGWSRAWTPCSFKIKANKQYELQNFLPYDFFEEKPYLKHKTLQIRNGGNDTQCRIKDPALQEIVFRSGIDIDCQAYQPVMHYINGRYAGVINVREPNNKHFVYANYGLDDDEIDQFEMSPDSGYIQKCGTYESMQRWYDLSAQCGTSDEAYEQIKQMVDIDEYCNYMAVQMYLGNWDWPQNNVKGFKPIMEGGRFRFVLFDLDGALNTTSPFTTFAGKRQYTFDRLYGEPISNIVKEIEFVTIFLNMIQNETFRKQFIDTYCLVAGSVFEPERCREIINELANRVSDSQNIWNEVYRTNSTPWSTANTLINNLSNSRQSTMMNALYNYSPMGIDKNDAHRVQLSTNIPEARLMVNDLPVPTNKFNGQLVAPITFKAKAPTGYKFLGWKLVEGVTDATTILPLESTWSYYDQGSLDGENWMASNYNASDWQSGQAPLGYFVGGERQHNTILDYGGSTNDKRPTYYFRHTLTLDNTPSDVDVITLNYIIDDGFVLYVNGTEAARYNMPEGQISYNTFATTYAHDNPDQGIIKIPSSLFQKGKNVIAVEIHNNNASSTDIYWEASLTYKSNEAKGDFVYFEEEYKMPSGNMSLQACYREMTDKEKQEEELQTVPVVINEVSAGNSIYVNDYFKKDDWIELYNTTNKDIDLEGTYLTDRSEKPTKCQITARGTKASTIIPAHGYKVIWCSKRTTDRELHVDFKLDNEDGTVIQLMGKDKTWADSIVYCAHNGDQTVGRYPDGGHNIYLMTKPTIGKSNTLNTYATAWEYIAPVDTTGTGNGLRTITSRSGGLSIAYTGQELLLKSEDTPNITLSIHTASGATVFYQQLCLTDGHERVGLSFLPAGIYIARLRDSEGNECSTKFFIKK